MTRFMLSKRLLSTLLSSSALMLPTYAYAQSAPASASDARGDILVTAQRCSQNLQDVPIQISAIGAAAAVIAIAAAYLKVSTFFVSFLTVLGAALVPVAAVYGREGFFGFTHRLAEPERFRLVNLLSLAIGATVGLVSYWRGAVLSPMPSLDSLLGATVSWLILGGWRRISDRRPGNALDQ